MKFDIIVCGGGISGTLAAISTARNGKKVLLAEQSGALGGAVNNMLVYPFMPYWTVVEGKKKYLSAGLFSEVRSLAARLSGFTDDMYFSPEYFKLILDRMAKEAEVTVLFHVKLCGVETKNGRISSVNFASGSGIMTFEADTFIDATGDGDLMYLAGCEFRLGRNEDKLCQPMTTCFRVANVTEEWDDSEERAAIQKLYREFRETGKITNPREDILYFSGLGKGIVHFNTTRVVKLDPTDPFDVSKAEMIAREQIFELYAFLKENSLAFKDSRIVSIASDIGVRESRMLTGEYVLTEKDLLELTMFEDRIALGNYDIDIHNPEGSGTSHYYFKKGEYYSIPYRIMVPKEYDNLLVTGRCVSATHEAQASIRIMPICATLGEAAGIAASMMTAERGNKKIDIQDLQAILRKNGAVID